MKRERLPDVILVIAQVGLSVVFLAGCGRDVEILKEASREPNATLRFADFRHSVYRGTGKARWDLHGQEAFIYQKNDEVMRIVAYGFSIKQFDQTDPMEITAKKGDMDYIKKVVHVEGDVVLKDAKGSVRGQRMAYDLEKKVATSSDPVTILRNGMNTDCTGGMVFERATDRMTCLRPQGTVRTLPGSDNRGQGETKKNSRSEDLFQ